MPPSHRFSAASPPAQATLHDTFTVRFGETFVTFRVSALTEHSVTWTVHGHVRLATIACRCSGGLGKSGVLCALDANLQRVVSTRVLTDASAALRRRLHDKTRSCADGQAAFDDLRQDGPAACST